MRKIGIAAAAFAVGAVLVAGTATYATGAGSTHPGPAGPLLKRNQMSHQTTTPQQKLLKSAVVSGFSGASLAAGGFTPIDTGETLICPATAASCTFEADMSVQAQGVGTGDAWAICLYVVDLGSYATCPYYGNLDSGFYENGTQIESLTVPPGVHTVQTQVFTAGGGAAYNYSLTYHAYKP